MVTEVAPVKKVFIVTVAAVNRTEGANEGKIRGFHSIDELQNGVSRENRWLHLKFQKFNCHVDFRIFDCRFTLASYPVVLTNHSLLSHVTVMAIAITPGV